MDEFPGNLPGNSHSAKLKREQEKAGAEPVDTQTSEPAAEARRPKQVVTGKVTQRKKPLGSRMKEMFFSGGGEDVGFIEHLAQSVIVPKIKDMLLTLVKQTLDTIEQSAEEVVHGKTRTGTTRTVSSVTRRPVHNYNAPYRSSPTRSPVRSASPVTRAKIRRSNQIQDIILGSIEETDAVIEELSALIDDVGHCTVGDLYVVVGITPNATDEGWGWTDIRHALPRLLSTDEYLLVMPPPIPIEN